MSYFRVLAVAAVSLSLALLAACPAQKSATAPISNIGPKGPPPVAPEPGLHDGALWTCQIGDYDPLPCKLSTTPDGWYLAKLLGSQRFKGTLAWSARDTAHFVGSYFCPWGDCGAEMDVTFKRDTATFVTDFGGDTISLRFDAALANEWGGAGYGSLTGDEQ